MKSLQIIFLDYSLFNQNYLTFFATIISDIAVDASHVYMFLVILWSGDPAYLELSGSGF